MFKKRAGGIAVAAVALAGGLFGAAPAQAQPQIVARCDVFVEPYDYPCVTAVQTGNFVLGEVNDAGVFVGEVRDEAGRVVFTVYCIAFPNQPECP